MREFCFITKNNFFGKKIFFHELHLRRWSTKNFAARSERKKKRNADLSAALLRHHHSGRHSAAAVDYFEKIQHLFILCVAHTQTCINLTNCLSHHIINKQ